MATGKESLLHRWTAAGDAGNVDAFDDYLHPDVVVHAPLGLSTTGVEAEKEAWRYALRAFTGLRHEIEEVVETASTLAARVVVSGTHTGEFLGIPATDRSFRIDQALFAHIRDGKAAEVWEIVDSGGFLEQLGVLSLVRGSPSSQRSS